MITRMKLRLGAMFKSVWSESFDVGIGQDEMLHGWLVGTSRQNLFCFAPWWSWQTVEPEGHLDSHVGNEHTQSCLSFYLCLICGFPGVLQQTQHGNLRRREPHVIDRVYWVIDNVPSRASRVYPGTSRPRRCQMPRYTLAGLENVGVLQCFLRSDEPTVPAEQQKICTP